MEIGDIFKIILFFTTAGASVVSFKVVKDNNIPMPKSISEVRQVSQEIVDKAPDAVNDIWVQDIYPETQEITQWFGANVVPRAGEFFEQEIKPKVEEQIEKQELVIKEKAEQESDKIKEQIPKTLNDIKDILIGDKKCRLICE